MSPELKSSSTADARAVTAQTIVAWIASWAESRKLKVPADLDTTFSDAGFDSLHSVELAFFLEEKLGGKIDDTILYDYPTFASLAEHLAGRAQPAPMQEGGASASDAAADW